MANVDSILFKQKILQTFKFTKKILERHNLKYIACGGTVLGAVRHQGFIPWDDDIDIYMPREDYNKFIQLNSESEKEGYQIVSVEHSYGYYLPFAKVIDNNTLTSLTLLIAQSNPKEKDLIIDLVVNFLVN